MTWPVITPSAALDLADEQFGFHLPQHVAVLGLVALWSGDPSAALDRFAEADRPAASFGWGEPSLRWWTPDHVELLLDHGRVDDAVDLLDLWATDATRTAREWVLARRDPVPRPRRGGQRGHPVRSSCSGRRSPNMPRSETRSAAPARTWRSAPSGGAPGRRARPARRQRPRWKRFESLGATCWAERARAELGRIGGRTRAEGLTAAERRVASLVAEGRTNREIATALFLGERTVASHLTHIYAKLGSARAPSSPASSTRARRRRAAMFSGSDDSSAGRLLASDACRATSSRPTSPVRRHERPPREERARAAAAELTNEGHDVRFEFAIHVPEDEIYFFVFDAPSADQAALAAQRAGLDPIRVVEAVTTEGTER